METRFATAEEMLHWNTLLQRNPDGGQVLQNRSFAEVKSRRGWKARYLLINDIAVTVLERNIPLLGKLWYLPKGPGVNRPDQLDGLISPLKEVAQRSGVFLIKLEPEIDMSHFSSHPITGMGLKQVRAVQATTSTVYVDLRPDLETIESGFSSKTRSNIRAALRGGVESRPVDATDENCEVFYRLLHETAAGRFSVRSADYYKDFWQQHQSRGLGQMWFAYVGDRVISADFLLLLGSNASRKDAASTRERSVRGTSAQLELEVIRWLKQEGYLSYDLCGAPPSGEAGNPDHPLHGLGVFKTGFNPEIVDFIGTLDLPVRQLKYQAWSNRIERVVLRIYRRLGKNFY